MNIMLIIEAISAVNALASLQPSYTASLRLMKSLSDILSSHSTQQADAQAALSHWVCQPLLDDTAVGGIEWFDEICQVEIPGWE